jgi:AcrR family transcriptional regulator
MDTRSRLAAEALAVIEAEGLAGFSTRAVCERANVTAPTLYHHFGDADGLINAAVSRGYEQFLERKKAQARSRDPLADVMSGWDDYIAFARERPRLYAAMTARILQGSRIAAARESRLHLEEKLARLAQARTLNMDVRTLADFMWATAHAGALLFVAAAPRVPAPDAIAALRQSALDALTQQPAKKRKRS